MGAAKVPAAIGRLMLRAARGVGTLVLRLAKLAGLAVAGATVLIVLDALLLGDRHREGGRS